MTPYTFWAAIFATLFTTITTAAAAADPTHQSSLTSSSPTTGALTPLHEPGRCAIRGQCGSKSWFGKQLPCVDNGLAEDPDAETREMLVELCGAKWREGPVCCTSEQVTALKSEMSTPNQIIGSCPACKENFFNLFCTFTCSPDQSLFLNVTSSMEKSGKTLVTELDQLIATSYSTGFYNSCANVKFGPSNANAMDFIGGGAKNASQLLKFLGAEKAIGSPFQINFPDEPDEYGEEGMVPLPDMKVRKCNDEDPNFRCACVDCPNVCPALAPVKKHGACHVGKLPCLSFASILTYSILLLSCVGIIVSKVVWKRHTERRTERLRLLQDATPSDDEDDDEVAIRSSGYADRPQRYHQINNRCERAFTQLGHFAARSPGITIGTAILFVVILSFGWIHFDLERDPAHLWVSPTSEAAREKAFFDHNFGPFYRAQQVFLVNDTQPGGPSPVMSYDNIMWWMGVEKSIKQLEGATYGTRLDDVCFKPLGDACVVQSVTGYWQGEPSLVGKTSWQSYLENCAQSPVECRPDFGMPLEPNMIFGGIPEDGGVLDAEALVVTWVVNNDAEGSQQVAKAIDFEIALRDHLLEVQEEAADRGLRLSFNTEASLEQELNKSTNTDAMIVVISYLVMFLYASISLGSTTLSFRDMMRKPMVAVVQSKFTLGIVGIIIVLMSITASIGLFSWFGLKATLIIAEVIPFIVLAVGVDNIFLIVHEFERINIANPDDMIETRVAKALGRMGPSILFSSITEVVSFSLGAFAGMPAVRNFAIYAAGAVLINAILQVTLFISILALNQARVEDFRADCFPCIQVKAARIHFDNRYGASHYYEGAEESWLQQVIRKYYAPALLTKKAKTIVVASFLALFAAAVALLPEIQLGLDQRVAIPDGSYLIPYFNDLYDYFNTGPPVYFITKEANVATRDIQRHLCARFTTCNSLSLTNILEGERKRPDVSFIASPTASWLDDFFMWLNPDLGDACCANHGEACFAHRDPAWNITLLGMPEGDEFNSYLERFLSSPTTYDCPLGGKSSYGNAVVTDSETGLVKASHFRTMHRPLRSQNDFIDAYASARRIAKDISWETGLQVFPYSVFYIFFDQYATIRTLTATLLLSALSIIFLVSTVLLGSLATSLAVMFTVAMSVVDIMGAMALFNVSLNAVSLVNLVICVGISVEFCAHIARAFMFPSTALLDQSFPRFRGRDARAWTALVNVGASVFSGITVTKFLGVAVLAFTKSKIFEIYYFRVWVALVAFAAGHALVFLPVVLSLVGGDGYVEGENDGGLEEDLTRRRMRALAEDSEEESDYED